MSLPQQEITVAIVQIGEKLKKRYGGRFATADQHALAMKLRDWIGQVVKNNLSPVVIEEAHERLMKNPRYREYPPNIEDYLQEGRQVDELRSGGMGESAQFMPVLDEIHARYRSLYGHQWGYQAEDMKHWAALMADSQVSPSALQEASRRWPKRPGPGGRPPTAPQLRDLAYFAQAAHLPTAEEAWRQACVEWRNASPIIQEARRRMGNFVSTSQVDEFVYRRFVEAYHEVVRDVATGALRLTQREPVPPKEPERNEQTDRSQFVRQMTKILDGMQAG